jgi:hypothetical protein
MRLTDRIRELQRARQRHLAEFVRLLESDGIDSSKLLDQTKSKIENVDFAVKALTSNWKLRVRSLAAATAAVGLLISALAVWPMHSVAFTLKMNASVVDVVAASDGTAEDLALKPPVRIVGADQIESGLLPDSIVRPSFKTALIVADAIHLTFAAIPANSLLEVESRPTTFSLSVQSALGGFTDELEMAGTNSVLRGESAVDDSKPLLHGDFKTAETVIFHSSPIREQRTMNAPVVLALHAGGVAVPGQILGVVPTSLRFVERQRAVGKQSPFKTSVLDGELTIVSTGTQYTLGPDDTVELTGIKSERFKMNVSDHVEIQASGTATGLHLSTGGFKRSVTPSVLEFASMNHRLALVWGGVVFLWGFLWSAWRLIKGDDR